MTVERIHGYPPGLIVVNTPYGYEAVSIPGYFSLQDGGPTRISRLEEPPRLVKHWSVDKTDDGKREEHWLYRTARRGQLVGLRYSIHEHVAYMPPQRSGEKFRRVISVRRRLTLVEEATA